MLYKREKALLKIAVTTIVLSLFSFTGLSQQKPIVEEVEVVNIVIPLRVFYKGVPVDGLQKKDFQLYENGKLQSINVFQKITRKIKKDSRQFVADRDEIRKKRFFVLVFNVFDYTKDVSKGIDYFFSNIYHKNDRVAIVTPERTFNIENSKEMIASLPVLKKVLKTYSRKAKFELGKVLKNLENEVVSFGSDGNLTGRTILSFFVKFEHLWNYYARKYLIPDVSEYYRFAEFLKDIKDEKWVIVFQQREVFPQLRELSKIEAWIESYVQRWRHIQIKFQRFKQMFQIAKNVPLDKIKEVFFKANATFYVLLLRTRQDTFSRNLKYNEVASDFEESFKAISEATGGDTVLSNKLTQSLQRISEHKDVYYILSYRPAELHNENRKIKVKIKEHKDFQTYYVKNYRMNPESPEDKNILKIDIRDFSFKEHRLNFSIVNYFHKQLKEKKTGLIEVKIMIMDSTTGQVVYEKTQTLKTNESQTEIGVELNFLKKGDYHLLLDIRDRLNGESRIFNRVIHN
jgi:hypothetical protein